MGELLNQHHTHNKPVKQAVPFDGRMEDIIFTNKTKYVHRIDTFTVCIVIEV